MTRITSPFGGTTEHETDDVAQAKREHKARFGLDGIESKDDEIRTAEEFQKERQAEHDALKKATKAAPTSPPPIMGDQPTIEKETSAKPQTVPQTAPKTAEPKAKADTVRAKAKTSQAKPKHAATHGKKHK